MGDGLRLALSLLTVAPVRADRIDRGTARTAMLCAPLVGAALGAVAAAVAYGAVAAGAPSLVAGVLVVALLAALTRGLHLDGLADTADGLGSYRDAEHALAVMKKSDIGPFGVVAIGLALIAQAAGFAAAAARPPLALLAGVVTAVATGRLAATWACRRGVPAARPEGLGALVAGGVPAAAALAWTGVLAAAAVLAAPHRPWLGPLAVAAGVAAPVALTRHAVRRFGGITGDVLGACVEVGTTVCVIVLTLTGPAG
jgi:adenosylcobinamide-GDP ribazoletransferase